MLEFRPSGSPDRNTIIPEERPELASGSEFVLKVGALCDSRTGSECWSSARPAHLTGTPLSQRNGPNWLPAPKSSCRWEACGTCAPEVTVGFPPFLLTSSELHYPRGTARIGFRQRIRPEGGSPVRLPHRK